ncbi:olfactory receptor 6N1-like [Acipenser oxyrinchus oxyrinchus]|uniref:Olfactory receptor 6N1-like n=1 Tax=Acipenser oxyrinchus oxyrinchus TaxID=40147 RepID=A0AAD8DIC5_ACIOX|nr:olfactory receptor 6N1-like [Acipenser oxyrinchus oxyrinchus]
MASKNNTVGITEFIITGFNDLEHPKAVGIVILIIYSLILLGSTTNICIIASDKRLHTPLYYLICNLAIVDMMYSSSASVTMLTVLLVGVKTVSYKPCAAQMFLYHMGDFMEAFAIGLMAFDRLVAISNPVHYSTIITDRMCVILVAIAWFLGLLGPFTSVILAAQLPFCGPNKLIYWFCDYPPVVQLACTDTTFLIDLALAIAMIIVYIPWLIIVWSYVRIIICIFRIPPGEGRSKAFSTCSSHLILVLTYFLSIGFVYIVVRIENISSDTCTLLTVCNCFITPMANPIIYSLRNKEIRDSFVRHTAINKVFP